MSYTIYPSDAGFNAPADSPHFYTKQKFASSSGARFVRSPYEYENPYNRYAEDIQYTTAEPLVRHNPYEFEYAQEWAGSANAHFGEDKKWDIGGWFQKIGTAAQDWVGKGQTKRKSKKAARKARKSRRKLESKMSASMRELDVMSSATKASSSSKAVGKWFNVSKPLMAALNNAPALDAAFQVTGPNAGLTGKNTFMFARSLAKKVKGGGSWDKSPLPRRTSTLFQGKALQTQKIAKPIMQAINPQQVQQQAQLTERSQAAEKKEEKSKKSNALLWGGAAVGTLALAGGGFFFWKHQKKKKQQGSQYFYQQHQGFTQF